MNTKQKLKLKRFINELALIKGRHTELVSVYVPAGYDLIKVIQHLQQEQGTASNIKDAKTRKCVIDSLEKLIRHLRLFKRTPPNGLAAFSGNVVSQQGKIDIHVWSLEPPEPIKTRIYRCDQTFLVDILRGMLEEKEQYGLIVMDRREATIGSLRGTAIKVLTDLTSGVPGKIRAGGQSAMRYARITEGLAKEFYKRISEAVNKEFLGKPDIKGILIGGPGPTKEEFIEVLNEEIKRKILAVQDLTYTDEFGLRALVEKSQDVLAKEAITEEKQILKKLFTMLAKEPEKVTYGKEEVMEALKIGAVETLLISEDIDDKTMEEFEELAEQTKAETKIISLDTNEGMQLKNLGGIAAILRYALHT